MTQDFSFIANQRHVFLLRPDAGPGQKRFAGAAPIYIVGSGRISVASMTEGNMEYLCGDRRRAERRLIHLPGE